MSKTSRYTLGREPDWQLIPEHMRAGLRRYIENGIAPGDFLSAVLCNDLREACGRADEHNRHRLFDYIMFLHNYAPIGSWGSAYNFNRWCERGGLGWELSAKRACDSCRPEYSVCQFLDPKLDIGDHEYVRRHVMLDEAMAAFCHYTSNVAAHLGFTHRVIITDGGDCIVVEWIYGRGVTWPMPERKQEEGKDEPVQPQTTGHEVTANERTGGGANERGKRPS